MGDYGIDIMLFRGLFALFLILLLYAAYTLLVVKPVRPVFLRYVWQLNIGMALILPLHLLPQPLLIASLVVSFVGIELFRFLHIKDAAIMCSLLFKLVLYRLIFFH